MASCRISGGQIVGAFVSWCWLLNTWPQGVFPAGITCFAGVSSLLGGRGEPLEERQWSLEFLSLLHMGFNLCGVPTMKRSCAIFWPESSDKYQPWCLVGPEDHSFRALMLAGEHLAPRRCLPRFYLIAGLTWLLGVCGDLFGELPRSRGFLPRMALTLKWPCVICWPSTRQKMPFQGDAPEGGDTFWWQLWGEIAWAEIGWWNGTS